MHLYSELLLSTLCEAPLTAITALSLIGYGATGLAYLYFGSFSHSSLQILSCSVKLDGESHWTAIFRSLQRCSIGFKSGLWRDIQRLVPKSLLRCLGCVLRVVVLLVCEPSPQSEVLSALQQVFIRDLSVLCSVHLSLDPD